MIWNLGVTGTRNGISHAQRDFAKSFLAQCDVGSTLRHGACLGADDDIVRIVFNMNYYRNNLFSIIAYPPIVETFYSHISVIKSNEIMSREDYLERNLRIVQDCNFLLAFPGQDYEVVRSGTWATVRMARRLKREHMIVLPDGTPIRGYYDTQS